MQLTDNTDYIKQAIAEQELKKMQAQQAAAQGGQAPTLAPQAQDLQGQAAQMQNVGQQQATQQQALAQGQQLAQAAGQQAPASGPNLGLAMALRKDKKKDEELANKEMSDFNMRPAMNFYSRGLNPMDIISDQ